MNSSLKLDGQAYKALVNMVIMGQLLSRSRGYDIRRAQLAGDPGTSWLVDGDIHALAAQMDILSDNAPLSDAEAAAKSVEASRDIVALYEEDPFPALPDELLALLFRKCEPEAFLAAWQVSRRWRGVASQVRLALKTCGVYLLTPFKIGAFAAWKSFDC